MPQDPLQPLAPLTHATDLDDAALQQIHGGAKTSRQGSRALEFESIKNDIQKLTQMQQALSNISNTMQQEAGNAIRRVRA